VEKCFDDLKNQLDMKRLRAHGRFSTDGRLLVQFIAVTLMSALRNKMHELKLDENFTMRQLLVDPETLSQIRFSGRYGKLLTETTKVQRAMMEGLGVLAETWLQKWREVRLRKNTYLQRKLAWNGRGNYFERSSPKMKEPEIRRKQRIIT